jgi:hypothetical protein
MNRLLFIKAKKDNEKKKFESLRVGNKNNGINLSYVLTKCFRNLGVKKKKGNKTEDMREW